MVCRVQEVAEKKEKKEKKAKGAAEKKPREKKEKGEKGEKKKRPLSGYMMFSAHFRSITPVSYIDYIRSELRVVPPQLTIEEEGL